MQCSARTENIARKVAWASIVFGSYAAIVVFPLMAFIVVAVLCLVLAMVISILATFAVSLTWGWLMGVNSLCKADPK